MTRGRRVSTIEVAGNPKRFKRRSVFRMAEQKSEHDLAAQAEKKEGFVLRIAWSDLGPADVTARDALFEAIAMLKTIAQSRVSVGIQMSASGTPAFVLMIDGQSISVSTEMYEYLKLEAAQRGVSEVEVYREEMQAQEELKRFTLPRDRLEKAAQRDYSHHPWFHNDEVKPF